MRVFLLICGLWVLAAETPWRQTLSPHFVVYHESAWMPPGFLTNIEKMHGRLRMDLSMFSPDMANERLNLYLYQKQQSYLEGEFKPAAWSVGQAIYGKKAVALFDQPDRKRLLEVLSHEATHLLFGGYWSQANREPPAWLDEGLAMMEEAEAGAAPEASDVYLAMAYLPKESLLPLSEFFKIHPTKDLKTDENGQVSNWYIQAYSIVSFLYRQHSRLQFKDFCSRLRDGKELKDTLWIVYRFRDYGAFQKAWLKWFNDPVHRNRADKYRPASKPQPKAEEPAFKPVKTFESFRR